MQTFEVTLGGEGVELTEEEVSEALQTLLYKKQREAGYTSWTYKVVEELHGYVPAVLL